MGKNAVQCRLEILYAFHSDRGGDNHLADDTSGRSSIWGLLGQTEHCESVFTFRSKKTWILRCYYHEITGSIRCTVFHCSLHGSFCTVLF